MRPIVWLQIVIHSIPPMCLETPRNQYRHRIVLKHFGPLSFYYSGQLVIFPATQQRIFHGLSDRKRFGKIRFRN
jgi:hypothetical protein